MYFDHTTQQTEIFKQAQITENEKTSVVWAFIF